MKLQVYDTKNDKIVYQYIPFGDLLNPDSVKVSGELNTNIESKIMKFDAELDNFERKFMYKMGGSGVYYQVSNCKQVVQNMNDEIGIERYVVIVEDLPPFKRARVKSLSKRIFERID